MLRFCPNRHPAVILKVIAGLVGSNQSGQVMGVAKCLFITELSVAQVQ